jgi:hypothetical protein
MVFFLHQRLADALIGKFAFLMTVAAVIAERGPPAAQRRPWQS